MPEWSHKILINSIDVTSETTLDVRVEETENASAVCDIRWRPTSGIQSGLELMPLVVTVDIHGQTDTVLFSGKIIRAVWNDATKTYAVRASNMLQAHFQAMPDHASVRAALEPAGAKTSADWLGEPPDDLWEYAEQIIETMESDVHINRSGALEFTPWLAKTTPDHILSESDIDDEYTVEFVRSDVNSKINRVILEANLSVFRWKIREHLLTWDFINEPETNDFCQWLQGTNGAFWQPPVLSQVQPTFTPKTWSVRRMNADMVPLDQPDLCFQGNPALSWQFARDSYPLLRCDARGYSAMDCEIQEKQIIILNATAAQSLYGQIISVRREASMTQKPPADWPPSTVSPEALPGALTDTINDKYLDQIDEARRIAMLDTAFAWGRARIRSAQRGDARRMRTILRPDINLSNTIRVSALGITSPGKVRRLVHTLSPLRTTIDVALSSGGGADDAYSAPSRPDSSDPKAYFEARNDPPYTYPMPSPSTVIPTYVGSRPTSPDKSSYSPDQIGYWSNAVNYPGFDGNPDKIYDDQVFRAVWPEREEEASDGMAFEKTTTLSVSTPVDEIT